MCLSLEKGRTTLKKADEDIVCYKVLVKNNEKGFIKSPYMWKPYKLGELKKDKTPVKKESVNTTNTLSTTEKTVESGVFHTFQFFEDAKKFAINSIIESYWGFFDGNLSIVVKCIIPKGTRYYEGMFGGIFYPGYKSYGSKQLKVGDEIFYIPTEEDIEEHCCPGPYIRAIKEEMQKIMFVPKERFNQ